MGGLVGGEGGAVAEGMEGASVAGQGILRSAAAAAVGGGIAALGGQGLEVDVGRGVTPAGHLREQPEDVGAAGEGGGDIEGAGGEAGRMRSAGWLM